MVNENERKEERKQRPLWPKLVDLLVRVIHVVASSVFYGGMIWAVPFPRLATWHHLTIASGIALIISGISGSRHWPYQGRGLAAALHIGLIALIHGRSAGTQALLTIILIIGVVGSHLPGFIRHWSLLHRRRVD